ncbi:SAM-dependent methyltransferase, partial [Candidatus Latescibacterota bacterium]
EDNFFDICIQYTVFTSIFDSGMKKSIAHEMTRVLKPDGIIIWYDFFMNNPKNPDVNGIGKKEIYKLFPDHSITLIRTTLAPPLARLIAPYSFATASILESLKFLNTHYFGIIRKK